MMRNILPTIYVLVDLLMHLNDRAYCSCPDTCTAQAGPESDRDGPSMPYFTALRPPSILLETVYRQLSLNDMSTVQSDTCALLFVDDSSLLPNQHSRNYNRTSTHA
jgi:hypothetical protein